MNIVFIVLILIAFGTSAAKQILEPSQDVMQSVTIALLHSAAEAVTIAIGLIGVLALFLGMIRILEEAGFMDTLSKVIYPLLKVLFPNIPANHPAFGAMTLNLSANLLGLGNAATPFGIKAMQALNTLNTTPGTATNAMVLFLAINTSSITLLPTKVIALRAEAHSTDPAGIITTTLFATCCSTLIAIVMAKLLERFYPEPKADRVSAPEAQAPETIQATPQSDFESNKAYPLWISLVVLALFVLLIPVTLFWGAAFSPWVIPSLFALIVLYGAFKKINVYFSFVEGAKEGFGIAVNIIPYLVAILAAIGLCRASGALDAFTQTISHITTPLGLPAEAIPMALMRPLSGSGSFGILTEIFKNPSLGPDSYIGYLTSTMMGSTETTFYVLAVYFGAVQIKRLRHAIPAALCADLAGITASVVAVRIFLAF